MNLKLRFQQVSCILSCLAGFHAVPAFSDTGAMGDLLEVLRDKGTISDSDYEALKKAAETGTRTVKVKTGTAGLQVSPDDGEFSFQVGGRLMVDAAFYGKDKTQLGNGVEMRRARLFAAGTVYRDWFYKAQLDFAGNSTSIMDMYLGYQGFEVVEIKIGHHKEPFGLEELTSSNYITFMERGLPNAFSPGRNTGLSISAHGEQWGARAGCFFDGVTNGSSPKSQGWGLSGRVHYAPMVEKERVVHLGAATSYRGSGGDNKIRFRERPESHVTGVRLVDTGDISDYDNQTLLGAEAALIFGPVSLQGEYMHSSVEVSGGASDPEFNGWYVSGSYFLTGEHRPYDAGSGVFGRVTPRGIVGHGGHGAWEVALRYSSIDLADSNIVGGEQDDITVGVNWYATPTIRFMANYARASTNPTSPVKFAGVGDEDVNIYQLRGQIDF